MATLKDVLKRLFARPDRELPEWAILQKYSRRSLETIDRELRAEICESRSRSIPYRDEVPTETRAQRHARVRAIAAQYPELSHEKIQRCRRLGYSEDLMLALRGAAIGERIRQR